MIFEREVTIFKPSAIDTAISTVESNITQTADTIRSEVSATYATKETAQSIIEQTAEQIALKVSVDDLVDTMNSQLLITGNTIELTTGHFTIDATNIKVTEAGALTVTGTVNATSGTIGSTNPWHIGGNSSRAWIYSGSKTNLSTSTAGVYIGTNGIEVKGATGNTGNVTRINTSGILTTYIEMYDSGKQASTFMYLDDRTTNSNGVYRMLFTRGIATGYSGVTSGDNYFVNYTRLEGGYTSGSDRRIKSDISRLDTEKSKAFIMDLIPSQYHFTNRIDTSLWHHGFVAQDVEKVAWDGLVSGEGDEIKGISYEEIIADIVAVLQDHERRLNG